MPNKIHILDEDSIRQIAAGEVVERPASVVKELLENSLDAASKHIALEIGAGGKTMIRVSDDGCGMSAADALLALERHATSKISSVGDLGKLATFGFRGEALPSIASVSQIELSTHAAEEAHGISIALAAGKLIQKKECGRAVGTTIDVKALFFNTPARLKFLKSETSEKSKILRTFEETAIAHPQIAFETKFENRKSTAFPGRKTILGRITDLWGAAFIEGNLIPLSFQHPHIQIEGWISHPQFHHAAKSCQIFYVNKRPILSRLLTHALYEAYRDSLPVGRHPAAVIFVTLDPSQVDVNVHPSKREVRFRNESQVYEALLREIRLKRAQLSAPSEIFPAAPKFNSATGNLSLNAPASALEARTFMPDNKPMAAIQNHLFCAVEEREQKNFSSPFRVLSQFHALYVIAQQGENLLIVDQHAAAERILYEQFKAALSQNRFVPTQPLLIPLLWNVSLSQAELLKSHSETLQKLGFILELFGEKTFRVIEAPALIPELELKAVMDEILSSLENEKNPSLAVEEKIMHAACRAAIKANDPLSNQELSELLEQLSRCSNPHTCPHGRPTTLTISRQELDKKFGRT